MLHFIVMLMKKKPRGNLPENTHANTYIGCNFMSIDLWSQVSIAQRSVDEREFMTHKQKSLLIMQQNLWIQAKVLPFNKYRKGCTIIHFQIPPSFVKRKGLQLLCAVFSAVFITFYWKHKIHFKSKGITKFGVLFIFCRLLCPWHCWSCILLNFCDSSVV